MAAADEPAPAVAVVPTEVEDTAAAAAEAEAAVPASSTLSGVRWYAANTSKHATIQMTDVARAKNRRWPSVP